MIEILFGESEAASMKVAKGHLEAAFRISGIPQEVVCLAFMLDIGFLKEPPDGSCRKKLIYSMLNQNQWGNNSEMEEELKQAGDLYAKELSRLELFLKKGEAVRIWYSESPYSKCGLYFVCHWMKKYDNPVSVVKLPQNVVRENCIQIYQNWGEAAPEEFAGFLPLEKKLAKAEMHLYAQLWADLVEENAFLRANVNGRILSVDEDFYDFLIWRKLTKHPVRQARLIGDILGCDPIGIGDWWYARRIDHFIEQGRIKVLEDSQNKYARTICLV